MSTTKETQELPNALANGSAEIERLQTRVRELQEESTRMRQTLAKTEMERDRYRQAYLDQARAARAFEDLDIPTLEAISAGPVEMIE
jgi:predicted nuclease with TOPRIM domain